MPKKFVIGTDTITPEQEQALQEYFNSLGTWWHWMPGFWLLLSMEDDQLTAAQIRDKIKPLTSKAHNIVLEIKGEDIWAGYGPRAEDKNMFNWLKQFWDRSWQ